MKHAKTAKVLFIIAGVLLVIELPWFIFVQHYVDTHMVKTTATVVRVESSSSICSGDQPGSPDVTCDHSALLTPVYRYSDQSGKIYEVSDPFFGQYKANNPLRKLFPVQVGDKVTAYYPADQPAKPLFMNGPTSYAAWLIPLFVSIPLAVVGGVMGLVSRHNRRQLLP